MAKKKIFKCPFCDKKYIVKNSLYTHMEDEHEHQLDGKPAAQIYFNHKNKKDCGHCIMCGKETKFNLASERYERLCSDKCKKQYRELFRKRMKKKYGKDTLLDDPNQQKKMLENRKISGKYKWSDGKTITTYTGSYEKDFLEFIDTFLNWNPTDIIMPSPQIFDYEFEGKPHFYIPDVYITSLGLLIEIKASDNKHYRERDIEKEKIKDKIVSKTEYNYLKIFDKQYDEFFNYIMTIIDKE